MKFSELLLKAGAEPVFSSNLLLSGMVNERVVRLQLCRWVKAGRLLQLRRGLYALAAPWRKVEPHPFLVANRLFPGSYVSLQSALAWHGAIPEHVPVVTSVGSGRPERCATTLGSYQLNHLTDSMSFGYTRTEVTDRQHALVAQPEKALLDLVYLTPGGDSMDFIVELRLQNKSMFRPDVLADLARRSGKPKLLRAAHSIASLLQENEGAVL